MEEKIYEASLKGDVEALNALLQEDQLILDTISLPSFNETPLHIAAMRGHLHFAKVVLSQNPKLAMALDTERRSPLHLASSNGNLEMVRELLRVGGRHLCCSRDQDGLTPLHFAAMNGHLEVVKALVLANPDAAKEIPATGETMYMRSNNLRHFGKPSSSSEKFSRTKPKGLLSRIWAWYLNNDNHRLEKQKGILIVAAIVVAAMAFHSGINPPGGTISDTINGRYELGNAVQTEVDMENFDKFVTYNTVTMIISLGIFLVLISGVPLRNKFWMWVLTLGTLFTVVCMVATYLQSLAMMSPDMYVNLTSVWICLIWMLVCGLMALIHTIFFVVWMVTKMSEHWEPETERIRSQDSIEV